MTLHYYNFCMYICVYIYRISISNQSLFFQIFYSTMSLLLPNPLPLNHKRHLRCCCSSSSSSSSPSLSLSGSVDPGVKLATEPPKPAAPYDYSFSFEQTKDRIRKLFDRVQLSVSSYDTAWMALIPSLDSSQTPFFPKCIDWLLDNQLGDGSWGRPHHHSLLTKDVLLSTLASVLALKRWGVGEEQINKGLRFIESNITSAIDLNQHYPIGFDVIFPGMVEYARNLDLNPPFDSTILDALLHRRELHLRRVFSEGRKSYLAYISEGLGKIQDWEMVMKYQRKNGSLFNSPSTTAAAFMHLQDAGCLSYLRSVLDKFGNAVPTVYPLDVYARLCMVDSLQSLGIERHFREEIVSMLDETYRSWLQGEEEIFLDSATCAIAFRLLRLNGYDVSSDPLTKIPERESEFSSPGGHLRDIGAALELYKASEIIIYPDELALEKQHSWSSHFLKQKFYSGTLHADGLDKRVSQEVDEALKFPFYANLNRVASRRHIENYNVDGTSILKTSFSSSNIKNEDFLKLAVEDFNICQSVHREEVKEIERWVVEYKLDQLKFARQKSAYCYFSAAAALFSPELSYARISWAKNGVLTTVVDDFFDVGGSIEELENLIQLVEKWDVNVDADCCSENVRIIFSAIHSTISEIGARAFPIQGRNVTGHVIVIWLDLLNSMLTEARWDKFELVPTMDEYMTNGYISFALGPIVLPALYLVGPKLGEEDARSFEYQNLFKLMSTCGRLLNDIKGFERESKQGKLNALSLHAGGRGAVSGEEVIGEVKDFAASQRRELLRLVLQRGSQIPQAIKDCFWKMSEVLHLFYRKDDGFTSNELMNSVRAIIYEPVAGELQGERI